MFEMVDKVALETGFFCISSLPLQNVGHVSNTRLDFMVVILLYL